MKLNMTEKILFKGSREVVIDSKGRLGIPASYRQPLQKLCNGNLVLTTSIEAPVVLIYPQPEWVIIEEKLLNLPQYALDEDTPFYMRMMLGHATECTLDSNGRILLPATLRKVAGLKKSCRLLGQKNKLELWDEQKWDDYLSERRQNRKAQEPSPALRNLYF